MKRFWLTTALAVAIGGVASDARADSYLFERSYYSHRPERPVPIYHRAPLGGPQFTRPQGFASTGGYRLDRSQLRVRGQVVEQNFSWDSWIQFQAKY